MAESFRAETAIIYQFPPKGRSSGRQVQPRRQDTPPSTRTDISVAGSGWYHEAALREAENLRKG